MTARGLSATTDAHGRFHITCAIMPREGRGSNFVLKLDDRTLPSGYRPSTEQVQVQRATRGKALKFNFGASIHRVVGLDLADAVFEPGTTEMRTAVAAAAAAAARGAAEGTGRAAPVVPRRRRGRGARRAPRGGHRKQITEAWEAMNASYRLTIEPEVFWRLGGPPEKSAVREPAGR